MTGHPGIDKITFTGSTATGKKIMSAASETLKRLTLELGGNDAAIVFPDVDIESVAQQIFFSAFWNTGQICVATKRLYVHEEIYDPFRDALIALAQSATIGDGLKGESVFGPLQNKAQYDRVRALRDQAKEDDLKLIEGCRVPSGRGYFFPITIVDDPPNESAVVTEEAFGPILPLLKFNDIDDVIERANDTNYGLGGSVWCADLEKATQVAKRLETGTVWINGTGYSLPTAAFGGHKESGLGMENGIGGLLEFTNPQTLYIKK